MRIPLPSTTKTTCFKDFPQFLDGPSQEEPTKDDGRSGTHRFDKSPSKQGPFASRGVWALLPNQLLWSCLGSLYLGTYKAEGNKDSRVSERKWESFPMLSSVRSPQPTCVAYKLSSENRAPDQNSLHPGLCHLAL